MSMVDTTPGKIQVRNLNFYYGKFHALKNISLDIAKNENIDLLTDPEAIIVTVSESRNDIPEEDTEGADSADA